MERELKKQKNQTIIFQKVNKGGDKNIFKEKEINANM